LELNSFSTTTKKLEKFMRPQCCGREQDIKAKDTKTDPEAA